MRHLPLYCTPEARFFLHLKSWFSWLKFFKIRYFNNMKLLKSQDTTKLFSPWSSETAVLGSNLASTFKDSRVKRLAILSFEMHVHLYSKCSLSEHGIISNVKNIDSLLFVHKAILYNVHAVRELKLAKVSFCSIKTGFGAESDTKLASGYPYFLHLRPCPKTSSLVQTNILVCWKPQFCRRYFVVNINHWGKHRLDNL